MTLAAKGRALTVSWRWRDAIPCTLFVFVLNFQLTLRLTRVTNSQDFFRTALILYFMYVIKRTFNPDGGIFNIVTYSGSIFTMEVYCTPKVNTLQLNTVGNSSNTRTRPTYTVSEHLTPIEFFQQDLLWQSPNTHSNSCSQKASKHVGTIHHRAIGPFARHNGTSAYSPSLACTSPDDRMSSPSTV
jgi:hypothetical protein